MVRSAQTAALPAETLYAILSLRAAVFVVEQHCAYLDLDGRDIEAGCTQLWVEEHGEVVATARLLAEEDGHRVGRLCTTPGARSRGLATALIDTAIGLADRGPLTIDAQTPLAGWYTRFGFAATGHEFVEDGIAHTEMRRT
ncbi:MAG: GNAT family N-acetyltransferase [Acidimicrobiales bacterium]